MGIESLKTGNIYPEFKRGSVIFYLAYIVTNLICFLLSIIYPSSFSPGVRIVDIVALVSAFFTLLFFLFRVINIQQATFLFSCVLTVDLIISDYYAVENAITGWEYILFRDAFAFSITLVVTGFICGHKTIFVQSLVYELMLLVALLFNNEGGYSLDIFIILSLLVFGFSFAVVIYKQNLTQMMERKLLLQEEVSRRDKEILQSSIVLSRYKSQHLKELLQHKERELTSQALVRARYNERDKLLQKEIQGLEGLSGSKLSKGIGKIVAELSKNVDSRSWEKFQKCFEDVHPGFYEKLLEVAPTISPAERKLATLIRLGLTSKEIASLSYTSKASVDVARSRLRKRLSLSRDENIEAFLVGL